MSEIISQKDALIFKAKSLARGRLLERFRCHVQEIVEHAEDEGDRTYFGSMNHFEHLKEMADEMDMWNWDSVIRQRDEVEPYAELRKLRSEHETVKKELLDALKYARRFLRGIDHDVDYVDAVISKTEDAI